jgi:UDP-N-acetyl-D-mannosaminuronic acid transferase (WecB/TagA/CpsF family)
LEKQTIIFTPNPEILLKAQSDKNFANLLNKATYKTPD